MAEFQINHDEKGVYQWKLMANNGQLIAQSANDFSSETDCYKSAEFVKRFASFANIRFYENVDIAATNQ